MNPIHPIQPHSHRQPWLRLLTTLCLSVTTWSAHAAAGHAADAGNEAPVELGKVAWGRDFEQAVAESKKSGKPMMVLFDEVPGRGGCKTYGEVLLSHPLLVEAAEILFVTVFIRNNDPDLATAREIFGGEGVLISAKASEFRDNDSNYQYSIHRRPGYFFNSITSLQATRMHGDEVANHASWLSPRQQVLGERIDALFKGLDRERNEALFKQMQQVLNPSQYRNLYKTTLADYHATIIEYLEKLEKSASLDRR